MVLSELETINGLRCIASLVLLGLSACGHGRNQVRDQRRRGKCRRDER